MGLFRIAAAAALLYAVAPEEVTGLFGQWRGQARDGASLVTSVLPGAGIFSAAKTGTADPIGELIARQFESEAVATACLRRPEACRAALAGVAERLAAPVPVPPRRP